MPYVPTEFCYEREFDHNGVMYYLGTLGYQTEWANPDLVRNQVRAFASSMAAGRPDDLFGRRATVCLT